MRHLGEQLDPEVLRDVVSQFFEIAGHEIRGHGGSVEQFSGDAAVGVFGMTASHEDDAERAVRAALAIVRALDPLQAAVRERHHVTVDVHIGIETGEVVSGDPFAGGTAVTGDALNVVARLEKSAAPGRYDSEVSVTKAFRRQFGTSPGAYRRNKALSPITVGG